MRARDSVTHGSVLRPGPAALAIALAGVVLSLGPVSNRIEAVVYDAIQGRQSATASPDVVLVDTTTLGATSIWDAERLPDLLLALGRAGARLVIPVEPPPLTAPLPDSAQLATLAEIERRTRAGSGTARDRDAETFARQLAEMRRRSDLQERTVAAGARLRNLVLAVPTFDGGRGPLATSGPCARHVLAMSPDSQADATNRARRVRAVTPLPESLCQVAVGAGHAEFWPDGDGVVRRMDLLLNASGTLVPSVALTATLAVSFPSSELPVLDGEQLRWDDNAIATSGGLATLLRFYRGADGARPFATVSAADVLRGGDPARAVAGRMVILGNTDPASGEPAYATPGGDRTASAELLATGLSNLLQSDFVTRPAWLQWLERALLLIVGIAALAAGALLPRATGIAAGAATAAALLGAEALVFLLAGVWAQLATAAAFAALAVPAVHLLQQRGLAVDAGPALAAAHAGGPGAAAAERPPAAEDELDLAFSMLRHQTPSDAVKNRLYEIALEHARRRDLAKAERVLRHLAGIDPGYRQAGDKLKKLAGLRSAAAQPAQPAPVAAAERADAAESGSLTGRTIGRYHIEQPIGRGAMATVYLGRDPKINRRVAIKTIALAEEFTEEDLVNARTQFLREAESAGRLNHPGIITIYDAGEDGQVAYLAMEYFPGKPLSHYAQQGQLLPARLAFELMARAAEALHYAHGQHVVHRDVKPANIMFDRSTDTLKITDFGIARLTDTSRTKTGIILGTPSYMSPEQLAGTNVTGQSDLFSLGITLYQLLTGMPPFRADSIPKLMQKIAHERHESVRALRDDLPPCVDELFDRALAKDPSDRFPSGRAMALALRECCSRLSSSTVGQPS